MPGSSLPPVVVLVTLVATLVALANGQPGNAANMAYPTTVQSSHCRYLIFAPTHWGTNASPFKLYTRSYSGEITRGQPIEVSILPYHARLNFFNFTDFALWAEPHVSVTQPVRPEIEVVNGPAPPPGAPSNLGVWQVFPQYSNGAGTMKCNVYTTGEDTVGSFEDRMIDLLKTQFPQDGRLHSFSPSSRSGAAFLWYPDERAMAETSIKFVAKLKSMNQWFRLESTPWKVHHPPPPRQVNWNGMMEQVVNTHQRLVQMERKLEANGAAGI